MKTKIMLIFLVLVTGISFGQVGNTPTFVNEEKIVITQNTMPNDYYKFRIDQIEAGKMYLKINEKQMNIFLDALARKPLEGTTTNFFLQNDLLSLEGYVENTPDLKFMLVIRLSKNDKATFMEFLNKIPK